MTAAPMLCNSLQVHSRSAQCYATALLRLAFAFHCSSALSHSISVHIFAIALLFIAIAVSVLLCLCTSAHIYDLPLQYSAPPLLRHASPWLCQTRQCLCPCPAFYLITDLRRCVYSTVKASSTQSKRPAPELRH